MRVWYLHLRESLRLWEWPMDEHALFLHKLHLNYTTHDFLVWFPKRMKTKDHWKTASMWKLSELFYPPPTASLYVILPTANVTNKKL